MPLSAGVLQVLVNHLLDDVGAIPLGFEQHVHAKAVDQCKEMARLLVDCGLIGCLRIVHARGKDVSVGCAPSGDRSNPNHRTAGDGANDGKAQASAALIASAALVEANETNLGTVTDAGTAAAFGRCENPVN